MSPIKIYPNFHCDRHLLSSIKRTSILKSSLNADELCQGIELFSRSQVSTTATTRVDFAWTERLWQSPGSRVLASTKPEIWAPVSKQKSHRILPVVDDKSVVVMIRYTTNIEAAAAKWVSSFHCKNCLKLPATPYVHTYLVYIENIGWSGELCWWSTWAFLRKFYMQNGSHHPIGKIP